SPAEQEWVRQKKELGDKNAALDRLMGMVGLEEVKLEFLKIKALIEAARDRKGRLRRDDLNLVLLGNAGTGKRTIARIYQDFLLECGVWPDLGDGAKPELISKTGYQLRGKKLTDTQPLSQFVVIDGIDVIEPYYMAQVLDAIDRKSTKLVTVLMGDVKASTKSLGARPHGRWLFRRRLELKDYDEEQLRVILLRLIRRNALKVEGGEDGPYPRVVAKRVARSRGSPGFGNVHDLMIAFEKVLDRQSLRLDKVRTKPQPEDVFLTMEDMIGPAPPDIRTESETWKELSSMIGLDDVKKAIGQLLDRAKENYRRETQLKEPLKTSLNRVFLGPPGTGKTTVAQLYGKLVGELGLLSTREVVMTTPGDYIGQYIGESEAKTSAILDSTVGKILIIDDAHMFFGGSRPGSGSHSSDIFRLGCIDTLISRIHNKPGDDRCVILLGYTAQMEEMFQKVNPGLRRRFPLEEAFRFEDYDDKQLHDILRHKMAKEEITASEPAMEVAAEVLRRARDRPNFGNGGDVENLLNQAKTRLRERHKKALLEGVKLDNEEEDTLSLTREDFDPEWDRGCHASQRIKSLFDGLIGFDSVVDKFKGYQTMAARMRARGRDPKTLIPFSYVFKGPPGTGKTHTARIVGQIFYDMGFLSTTEVVECSASNLIGKYCGHTAPKVVDLFERGLGKVVFIDEAYRLSPSGGGGHNKSFEEEAIGEIVDCMTKPQFYRKLVVVLAGYDHDMEDLMKVNAGLRSRFATDIVFPCMTPVRSRMHLLSLLENEDIEVWDAVEQTAEEKEVVLKLFHRLGKTPGWANARDVKTLAGQVTIRAYTKGGGAGDDNDDGTAEGGKLRISTKDLVVSMKEMLKQRLKC
ncbi:P-loop containing nucleoside triphosphate hydrolase protein, partial [Podospora didyma]